MKDEHLLKDREFIIKTANEYEGKYNKLLKDIKEKTSYEKYCKGGDLHRGFYCPSLIYETVFGGAHRGTLKSKKPPTNELTHIFKFDANGNLIAVKTEYDTEFIIKEGNVEIGITFNDKYKDIGCISICEYEDQRIKTYIIGSVLWNKTTRSVFKIQKECYDFSGSDLTVDFYDALYSESYHNYDDEYPAAFDELNALIKEMFNPEPEMDLSEGTKRHFQYRFKLEDGFLTEYTFHEFNDRPLRKNEENDFTFVLSKRKRKKIID